MKSNQKYKTLKKPSYLIYLAFMAAFALAALYFRQYWLAAAEGGITLILAVVALVMKRRNTKLLTAYIESITYDTENAKNSTLLSFPLPMAVFRLSDSSVVWANDAFFQMFGVGGARVDAQLAAMIPDFSGAWLMEGKTAYPSLVEISGHKYQMFGNLIRSEQDDENSAIMGITYWMDVTDYDNINSQVIQFGENLLDMIREVRGEDLCTVVVPLGAKDEETEERLTIASVNDGKDYIEDAEAIALYGRIVKVIEYDDVTLPENLMRKGQSVLNSQRLLSVCITLTAVDLHLLNVDIEKIKLGDLIRVISKPHGLDEYLMIQKLELDISHPENSKVTLGITKQTLAAAAPMRLMK